MKKFLLILLSATLMMGCLASCTKKPPESMPLTVPADEITVTKTFTSEDEMGLQMEITVSGYASESLNAPFYVKNGEAFDVEVKVKNPTEGNIPHLAATMCRGSEHDFLHDLQFYIQDGEGNSLAPAWSAWYTCPEAREVWYIPAGKTCAWSFSITPDIQVNEEGFRDFFGTITFAYSNLDRGLDTENNRQVATGVFIKVYEFAIPQK